MAKKDKGIKKILIATAAMIIIIGMIISLKFIFRQDPETITGLITKTLEGEEDPEKNYMYNGFIFVKVGPVWQTQWQSGNRQFNILLHFSPKELEDIRITGELDERFDSREVYITFDPLGSDLQYVALANGELSLNLVRALEVTPTAACNRNETDACSARPIINCTNTDNAVIYFKEDEESKIILDGNCITLQGSGLDIVKVTNRLIYQWYGIMR